MQDDTTHSSSPFPVQFHSFLELRTERQNRKINAIAIALLRDIFT